jgi:ribonuclease J
MHAELSKSMGTPEENIFVMDTGQTLEFTKNTASIGPIVPSGHILVDGLGVGDVGNIVLRDRKHLSEDGLLVVVITMNKKEGKVAAGPDIVSRGFVYVRESEDLMDEAKKVVAKTLKTCESKKISDWSTIKSNVRDDLRSFLYSTTKRNPMILPIIMEV